MKRILIALIGFLMLTFGVFSNERPNLSSTPSSDEIIADSTCEIHNIHDFLMPLLFPFDFENFDSQKMLKYFVQGTVVDSVAHESGGYTYSIYTFRNEDSYLSVLVKPESNWFYVDRCLIKGEFLKSTIHLGLARNQFTEIVGLKNEHCETLQFFLGELTSHYTFDFEDERLVEMYMYSTE